MKYLFWPLRKNPCISAINIKILSPSFCPPVVVKSRAGLVYIVLNDVLNSGTKLGDKILTSKYHLTPPIIASESGNQVFVPAGICGEAKPCDGPLEKYRSF